MASTTYDFPTVIKRTEDFSQRMKSALVNLSNAAAGKLVVVTATEAGPANTTLTNTTVRVNGLKAGKSYMVECVAVGVNATAANGFRAALDLTGTQTTAVFAGNTSAQATGTTLVQTEPAFADAAAGIITGATITSPCTVSIRGFLKPQNDGDLVLQIASGGSTTIPTLQLGSYLRVMPLDANRYQ